MMHRRDQKMAGASAPTAPEDRPQGPCSLFRPAALAPGEAGRAVPNRDRERGQVTPLVAVVVLVVALVALGVARLGAGAVDAARARTAADAAALAGAAEGRAAADEVAAANGGRLVFYEALGTDVVVTVEVGQASVRARARAWWEP